MRKVTNSLKKRKATVDKISELPDEILISILSRLTVDQAQATSILSTRWRHLYTYIDRLSFPAFTFDDSCVRDRQDKRFLNYTNMVDRTLDSYKGSGTLKEFRINMSCFQEADIERWFEFALARKVEVINIHLDHLIDRRSALQLQGLIKKNCGKTLASHKWLRQLSLDGVDVDDQEVELLLSDFPCLDKLSISNSLKLRDVSIVGHAALKLKHLSISNAGNLQSIKIDNMINLVSLGIYNIYRVYNFDLSNVPKLTEFTASECWSALLFDTLVQVPSCILDQLQLLKLSTYNEHRHLYIPTYTLVNVKHLELEVYMDWQVPPDSIFPVIQACPSLETLEIKFLWLLKGTEFEDRKALLRHPTKKLSPSLKRLKLSGYLGCPSELELVLFIMKNVAHLKDLIVEACNYLTPEIRRMATTRAWKHFRPLTRTSIHLQII